MAKVTYSKSFLNIVEKVLEEMVKEKKTISSMPEPFSTVYVVIGGEFKESFLVMKPRHDLGIKDKIYVVPSFALKSKED